MPGPLPNSRPAALDAEAGVRALLAQQKWRQARDELKALVKADRARFLPLLIDANLGLARKMLASDQISDARQVIDHLKKLAPSARLREIELEIALRSGGGEDALAKLIAALADSAAPLADGERVRFADAAMLTFQPVVPNPSTPPAQARVMEEMGAVQAALEAVSRSSWAEVTEALRRVSFRSPFGHWAVFVKGLAAFYGGEDDRAVKLWRSLPPASVPAKTSRAYLVLVAETTADGLDGGASSAALDGACRIIARSDADLLLRADRLWRDGETSDSYLALRNKLAGFPSVGLDWRGTLSTFYFNAPHSMALKEWREYLDLFLKLDGAKAFKDDVETMFALRLAGLLGRRLAPVAELRRYWKEFLRIHQSIHGTNPRFASLGYGWLGEQLSMPEGAHDDEWEPEESDLADYAIKDLETSIQLDPTNLKAQLHLCKVFENLGKTSERNRLLDGMTERFPDDKNVLVAAGRGCLERNAFKKALDYLERARHLDRLDPQIPRLIVAALEGQARTYFQQRRRDDALQALARTEEWLTERPDDFQSSRWSALARRAAMEEVWGVSSQGKVLVDESRRLSALAAAPWLIAHLGYRQFQKRDSGASPFLTDFKKALGLHPTPLEIGLLMRILDQSLASVEKFNIASERGLIIESLREASDRPFTRADAVELMERAGNHIEYQKVIGLFARKLLRNDPEDPPFALWSLKFGDGKSLGPGAMRENVEALIAEATRRRDEATLRGARAMLRELDSPPAPDFDYFDDDDDDDDDDGDDGLDGAFPPGGIPPGFMETMAEFLTLIKKATPAEIRELRRNPPPGIPKFILEEMIEVAKSGVPLSPPGAGPTGAKGPKGAKPLIPLPPLRPVPPPPARPGPKSARPTPPPSDPNQLNLF